MKVSDIYECGNVWAGSKVTVNDAQLTTIYDGGFQNIPEEVKNKDVDFWTIVDMKERKDIEIKIATKIFVALK